jgi:hypothetical protein
MSPISGPTNTPDSGELGSLSAPNPVQRDCDPAFTVLAPKHPDLIAQLRGMFFRASFQEAGAALTEGVILRLAAALYAKDNDALRGEIVRSNREQNQPLLDLGRFAYELDMRGFPVPNGWNDLPEPLRLIDEALIELGRGYQLIDPVTPWSVVPGGYLLRNPLFVPTQLHIDEAIARPGSPLAEWLVNNANQPMTPKLVAAALADPYSRLAETVAASPKLVPPQEFIDCALANDGLMHDGRFPLTSGLVQNPNLNIAEVIGAVKYVYGYLATGLCQNPKVTPPQRFIAAAIALPYTDLACAVAGNPNLTPPQELIDYSIDHPNSRLARAVANNPNRPMTPEVIAYALRHPDSCLAEVVARHTRRTMIARLPSEELIRYAVLHPDTVLASDVASKLTPSPELVRACIADPDSLLARGLVRNPKLIPSKELIAHIIAHPDRNRFVSVVKHRNVTMSRELVTAAIKHPKSDLAWAVGVNPRLFTWEP